MTSPESQPAAAPAETVDPSTALDQLEARLADWRREAFAEPADPRDRLRKLARLESEFREGSASEPAIDDSALAQERLLNTFVRWRDRLDAGAADEPSPARAAADARHGQALELEVERLERRAESALGADSLAQQFSFLADALEFELGPLAQARDGKALRTRLRKTRSEVRSNFESVLARQGAAAPDRDRWAAFLRDTAEEVLTGIDTLAPRAAAARLGKVAALHDWFLREVETARGPRRRRVQRSLRRLRAEAQERALQDELEDRFGTKQVARFELVMLVCVLLVLALFLAEALLTLSDRTLFWLRIADTALCVVFLFEFGTKLRFVRGRGRWFARHFFVDLVPSIPFALLLSAGTADPARAGRALRLLRLPRIARYVRLMMPILRVARALGFLARGLDRLARSYRSVLDFGVVLTPNRRERQRSRKQAMGPGARVRSLIADIEEGWETLASGASESEHQDVVEARLGLLSHALDTQAERSAEADERPSHNREHTEERRAELTAEAWIFRLQTARATEIEQALDPELLARLARAARLFARAPLVWLPVIRQVVPRLAPDTRPAEVLERVAHRAGDELDKHVDRVFFVSDLFGTITPSEFVDRVGAALVKGSSRPAIRLMIFGGFYLVVLGALEIVDSDALQGARKFLGDFVGSAIALLGAVCLVVLALGWWLRRLAQDATTFFEQTAAAQFLALTSSVKSRVLARDVALLEERVLGPESRLIHPATPPEVLRAQLTERVRARMVVGSDAAATPASGRLRCAPGDMSALERVSLLYRHDMSGALFGESDTHTTSHLLGNPSLVQLRAQSQRVDRRERKALRALDLDGGTTGLRGPYLWFSLIARAAARSAARLIVDYNRHAIPLVELESASDAEREHFRQWRLARTPGSQPEHDKGQGAGKVQGERTITSAFTALHFLDDDPQRDAEVRERFGDDVLNSLRDDRRGLFRTLLGTYPLHERPRSERLLNPSRLYDEWIAGGRVFLMPFRLALLALGGLALLIRLTFRAARDIRQPGLRRVEATGKPLFSADFATAVRKLDRMRGPTVRASLWARARLDPEYLGLSFAGLTAGDAPQNECAAAGTVEHDLAFIGSEAKLDRQVHVERRRAEADLRRIEGLIEDQLLERLAVRLERHVEDFGPDHRRALVVAYRGDLEGVRSLLSAEALIEEAFAAAPRQPWRSFVWPRLGRRKLFREYWAKRESSAPAVDNDARLSAWRAVRENRGDVATALELLAEHGAEGARELGEARLAEILRHPARLSEQIVTLRTVQTLSLIDLLHYREHVFRLGGFAEEGDDPGDSLTLAAGCAEQ